MRCFHCSKIKAQGLLTTAHPKSHLVCARPRLELAKLPSKHLSHAVSATSVSRVTSDSSDESLLKGERHDLTVATKNTELRGEKFKTISVDARAEMEDFFIDSPMYTSSDRRVESLPKFTDRELVQGRVLGRGRFGVVKEINRVNLFHRLKCSTRNETAVINERDRHHAQVQRIGCRCSDPGVTCSESEHRNFVADNCTREDGNSSFAIKHLREECLLDPKTFYQAAKDLACEVYILSTIDHKNIIKIHGIATSEMCTENYFVIMDMLYDTLPQRTLMWKRRRDKMKGIKGRFFDRAGRKKDELFVRRLRFALDLANALNYLHSRQIIHRDLKPDNIGFDGFDDIRIFDFGLARELRMENAVEKEMYKLTGMTGTMRFMAPEVYREQPYNEKADVYSFGLILWQIVSLKRPFSAYSKSTFVECVFESGERPKIDLTWPDNIQRLIQSCWSKRIHERPSAANIEAILHDELVRQTHIGVSTRG